MKAVIFDLDGTLLNTVADINKAINCVLEDYNYPLQTEEETMSHLGLGFEYLVSSSLDDNEDLFDEALNKFAYYYDQFYFEKTVPYPGIDEMLALLQQRHIQLAINSNKRDDYTKKLVAKCFPDINFAAVFGAREGINKKPDPTAVNEIINIMNINKKDVLYIGDSFADYLTAQNANIAFLAVTWGFRKETVLREKGIRDFAYNAQDIINRILD